MTDNLYTLDDGLEASSIGFSTIFISILLVILVITLIHLYFTSQESYKLGIRIPGPEPFPIFGNALMAIGVSPDSKLILKFETRRKVVFFVKKKKIFRRNNRRAPAT